MTKEYKSFESFEIKMDGDLGIVEHIVSVFGVLDRVGDIVHPSAFAKTIVERGKKVLVLDNHNASSASSILGKPMEIREIGRSELPPSLLDKYPDASGGLWAKTQFAMGTQAGKEAFELIKMGALQEWSFAYDVVQKDYSEMDNDGEKQNIRNLRELKLYEYSPVLWGANSATMTTGVKAEDSAEVETDTSTETSLIIEQLNTQLITLTAAIDAAKEIHHLACDKLVELNLSSKDEDTDTEPTTDHKAEPDTPEAGPSETPTSDDATPLTLDVDRIKSVVDVELEMIDLLLLDI